MLGESETYLRYIIENYDNLPDCCVFSQAKIKDHMTSKIYRKPYLYLKQLEIESMEIFHNHQIGDILLQEKIIIIIESWGIIQI